MVAGPVHQEQKTVMQELISTFVEYENVAGVSPAVIACESRSSPVRGPQIATRVAYTRRSVSRARPQSSMMSVFAVNNRSVTPSSSRNNTLRMLAPAQPVLTPAVSAPSPAMPQSVAIPDGPTPGGAFPPGALELHQPFKLGQPVPLGVKLPTNNTMTAFKWEAYKRRSKDAFDWNDRKSLTLANHWRSRVTQGAFKRVGINIDRRRKTAAALNTAAGDDDGDQDGENEDIEEE